MKLRTAAACISLAALAACDRSPTGGGVTEADLAGVWVTDAVAVHAQLPDGDHPVSYSMRITFTGNAYRTESLMTDAAQSVTWTDNAVEGTYRLRGDVADVTPLRVYYRGNAAPTAAPVLQPVQAQVSQFRVALNGARLYFGVSCSGSGDAVRASGAARRMVACPSPSPMWHRPAVD